MNLSLLKSRKFWATAISLLLIVLRAYVPDFPLSDETLTTSVMALIAYVIGTALEDGLKPRAH